jgi:hypothetical protein
MYDDDDDEIFLSHRDNEFKKKQRNKLHIITHNYSPDKYPDKYLDEKVIPAENLIIMDNLNLVDNFSSEFENRLKHKLQKYKVNDSWYYNSTDENLLKNLLVINPLIFSETKFGAYCLSNKLHIMYHLYDLRYKHHC